MAKLENLKVQLQDNAENGNFNHVLELFSSSSNIFNCDSDTALRIIVGSCRACVKNLDTPEKLSVDDLKDLMLYTLKFLGTALKELEVRNYVLSLYHIIKFITKKRRWDLVIELREFILPCFIDSSLDPSDRIVYKNTAYTINKYLTETTRTASSSNIVKVYAYEILNIVCHLWQRVMNREDFYDHCIVTFEFFVDLESDDEKLEMFFFKLISLSMKCPSEGRTETEYKSFLCFCHVYFAQSLNCNKFEKFKTAFTKCMSVMRKFFIEEKDYVLLQGILQFGLLVCPIEIDDTSQKLSNSHACLKRYHKKYKENIALDATLKIITTVVTNSVQFYKNVDGTQWINRSIDDQIKICNILLDISNIYVRYPYTCSHCKCEVHTMIYDAVKVLNLVMSLTRVYLTGTGTGTDKYSEKYIKLLLPTVEDSLSLILQLKNGNFDKWSILWPEISVHIYNISIVLYKQEIIECRTILKLLLKTLNQINLEKQPSDDNVLYGSLVVISETCFKLKEFGKCLAISSILLANFPNKKSTNIIRWIKVKCAAKEEQNNDSLQGYTVCSVLEIYKSEVDELYSNLRLTKEQRVEMLIYELEQYNLYWRSKVPIMAAYRELSKIADPLTIARVSVNNWNDGSLNVHEDFPVLLYKNMLKYEEYIAASIANSTIENKLYLAFLYYLHHRYKFRESVTKHCDDINKTMSNFKTESVPTANNDLNDECDIWSSYKHLKINKYTETIKYLNKALNLLVSVVQDDFKPEAISSIKTEHLFNLMVNIGSEFRLHQNLLCYLQLWNLALKVAEAFEENVMIIRSISFLIEFADVRNEHFRDLIEKAEKIVDTISSEEEENAKIVTTYYICKGMSYLYVDVKKSFESYQLAKAKSSFCQNDTVLKARLHLLHGKLIVLPCENNIEGHKEYSLVKFHRAFSYVLDLFNLTTGAESSYDMSVIFEINEAVVEMFHLLRMPRDVRRYGRDIILLAQRLLLPIRTMTLLIYLAYADLLSCRLDDAKVKIDGLSELLCVTKNSSATPQKKTHLPCDLKTCKDIDDLADDFQEFMLDVPKNRTRQTSPGSPSLFIEPFKTPQFMKHSFICECFQCLSLEYQYFIIVKAHLDAMYFVHQGNLALAKDFFFGGMTVYHFIKNNKEFLVKKYEKRIPASFSIQPSDFFLKPYCHILLDYGNALLQLQNLSATRKINDKLFKILDERKLQHIYLHYEVVMQKINLLYSNLKQPSKKPQLTVQSVSDTDLVRTPESKTSIVTFKVKTTLQTNSPPKRKIKKTLFDLSCVEGDDALLPSSSNKLVVPKKVKELTPASIPVPKTPFVPKIEINTPDVIKTTRKKKQTHNLKSGDLNAAVLIDSKQLNFERFGGSGSGQSKASVSEDLEAGLRTKTKLLTEKLKNNCKVANGEFNNENKVKKAIPVRVTRASSRKVLTSDRDNNCKADGSDGPGKGGRSKKSTKNK